VAWLYYLLVVRVINNLLCGSEMTLCAIGECGFAFEWLGTNRIAASANSIVIACRKK
jgi:hypothetical protein